MNINDINIVVWCKSSSEAILLFEVLAADGYVWDSGDPIIYKIPFSYSTTDQTCYRLKNGTVVHSPKNYYDRLGISVYTLSHYLSLRNSEFSSIASEPSVKFDKGDLITEKEDPYSNIYMVTYGSTEGIFLNCILIRTKYGELADNFTDRCDKFQRIDDMEISLKLKPIHNE